MTSVASIAGTFTSGTKRGTEELLGSTNMSKDQKKAKLDNAPSKVVHIRNIPPETTEAEIVALGIPFGSPKNVLLLRGKGQAFLEMADETAATTLVNYYDYVNAAIRGRLVYLQYSTHRELKTDSSQHSPTTSGIIAAAQAASVTLGPPTTSISPGVSTEGGPNTVLWVTVEHVHYPVNVDTLNTIFSRFGPVLKIITFTKNNQFQALIQMSDALVTQSAKIALDGQNIYNGCCTLHIQFSKLTSLNVKFNNEKSRDYTKPDLPSGDSVHGLDHSLGLPFGGAGVLGSPLLGTSSPLLAAYGGGLLQGGVGAGGLPMGCGIAGLPNMSMNMNMNMRGGTCVMLVSNLNDNMVTCDDLFTLFGVYGDVQRVKILYNKKDSALIQVADAAQAQLAISHLNGAMLYGKEMRVTASKHNTVSMPRDGQDENNLTKDFTNSTLHRFKKPGSKNFLNIFPPCRTLHLSNIPASTTEEELKELVQSTGGEVTNFRFFPKDRKMALVQLASVEESIHALIKLHNTKLGEQQHLRVSFAKTNM